MMMFSTPFSDDLSMMVFRAGIRDSHPSRPKRFSADHFFCRNSSNLSAHAHAHAHAHVRRPCLTGHCNVTHSCMSCRFVQRHLGYLKPEVISGGVEPD